MTAFLLFIIALGVVLSVPALRTIALLVISIPVLALVLTWLGIHQ
jgi:hypothetical protein